MKRISLVLAASAVIGAAGVLAACQPSPPPLMTCPDGSQVPNGTPCPPPPPPPPPPPTVCPDGSTVPAGAACPMPPPPPPPPMAPPPVRQPGERG